jgi:hypothetical protein
MYQQDNQFLHQTGSKTLWGIYRPLLDPCCLLDSTSIQSRVVVLKNFSYFQHSQQYQDGSKFQVGMALDGVVHIETMSNQTRNQTLTYSRHQPVQNNYRLNKIYHELVKTAMLETKAKDASPSKSALDKD